MVVMTSTVKIIDTIKQTDWYADWSGPFPLLEVSTSSSEIYLSALKSRFGKSFTHFLVLYQEGIASARLPQREFKELGEHLARQAQDASLVRVWARTFKELADALAPHLRRPAPVFLEKLRSLSELYRDYGTYNVATKVVFDYLPAEADGARRLLAEARKYSETFYKNNAAAFSNVGTFLEGRTGYPRRFILMMTREELYDYQASGQLLPLAVLEQRFLSCGLYGDGGGIHLLSSSHVKDIENFWLQQFLAKGITGTAAYPGRVSGVCRIILDYRDARLYEGEILVTGMTDPHFVPLLRKAAAIVTDGGGLLSHAAIVARELRKPCVIGTKVATRVLHDGDEVEVDADKGVVRIL